MKEPLGYLGGDSPYHPEYRPDLLFPISRSDYRLANASAVSGEDRWWAWELSWLRPGGIPTAAVAVIVIDANSECIPESKSLKLYLGSFNQTLFDSPTDVKICISKDLSALCKSTVDVEILDPATAENRRYRPTAQLDRWQCIDDLPAKAGGYLPDPQLLRCDRALVVDHCLYSHLLRSLCPVTAQPDWATVLIRYSGARIQPESLLQYLVSFRGHQGFHEQCVERIYADITSQCRVEALTIEARYLRRGGIDINPIRSSDSRRFEDVPLARQ